MCLHRRISAENNQNNSINQHEGEKWTLMTVNKCSKQYQLRDKISSLSTFFFLFDRFRDVRLSSFLSRFFTFLPFNVLIFFLLARHQLQSLLQLCLKTVSRKGKYFFLKSRSGFVVRVAKTHLAFHFIIEFHSSSVEYSSDRRDEAKSSFG